MTTRFGGFFGQGFTINKWTNYILLGPWSWGAHLDPNPHRTIIQVACLFNRFADLTHPLGWDLWRNRFTKSLLCIVDISYTLTLSSVINEQKNKNKKHVQSLKCPPLFGRGLIQLHVQHVSVYTLKSKFQQGIQLS